MLAGRLYDSADPVLSKARARAKKLLRTFNAAPDETARVRVLRKLLGKTGRNVVIEPPFYCDYGAHIRVGDRVYFNANCVVLDPSFVTIGNDVLLGPAVQIYTATHPLDYRVRRKWIESAKPVHIGSDVWIGGGAIVLPGVTIGDRSVIGAGSVVTKSIPAGVLAVGNPCRVIRRL